MSKAFKAIWQGDSDPEAQMVSIGDLNFVKGETVNVPADFEYAEKVRNNPTFAVDTKAEVVEEEEPQPVDPEKGTVKAALKAKLREYGEDVKGNPSEDTLRNRLAAVAAKKEA